MFNGYWGWFKVDKLTQSVDSGGYVTFNVTAKPSKDPIFTNTTKAPVYFKFIAYDKNSSYYYSNVYCPFTNSLFNVLVDNQKPKTINHTIDDHRSTFISIANFTTEDIGESYNYSMNDNDTAGIAGIISYVFTLKRTFDNQVIVNTPISCKKIPSSLGFSNGVTPNTNYTITVKAIDLAGNFTSSTIPITTPPAPPKTCTITGRDYCSITLSWPTSDGASGYYVYDASFKQISNSMLTGNSYTISGLKAGTSYNYYIAAYSVAGGKSELSTSFSASTLALPIPSISSSLSICSSDKTMTVSPVLGASSYSWTVATPLSINGSQTYTSTSNSVKLHTSTLSGTSIITVSANLACGFPSKSTSKSIRLGLPSINSSEPIAYYDGSTYNNVCNGQSFSTSFNIQNEDNVQWTRIAANPETTEWHQSGDNVNFYFYYVNQTAVFRMDVSNGCGTISHNFGFKSIDCSGGGGDCNVAYTASPNPASDKTNIIVKITAPCSSTLQETTFDGNITVFDNQGLMKKRFVYKRYEDVEFDISDLKNGIYYLEIFDGTTKTSKTIVVKH